MERFLEQVRRLEVHQRVWWYKTRLERTQVFETVEEVTQALQEAKSTLCEIEVYRAGERRYVVYWRE